ncbi:hypothetical protein [Okeania sp. SIO3B5]|nr:hypothetical protein [Okeania sp. SIO3B5]
MNLGVRSQESGVRSHIESIWDVFKNMRSVGDVRRVGGVGRWEQI